MNEQEKTPVEEIEKKTVSKKLSEADFELTESMQQMMTAIPPAGTTREDLLNPVFWTHVAKRLETMAEIRVMPKDGAWYGTYLVTFCDKVQVHVQELSHHKIEKIEDISAELYLVKWVSPAPGVKHCVIRKEDGERVSSGHETKHSAHQWIKNNAK